MTLGEKIQQLRKATGISQEQLAEQLGVSRQSVSKWELDDAIPETSKIVLLSELFSISTDELLKNSCSKCETDAPGQMGEGRLEKIAANNAANRQRAMGFKTIILGLVMLVLELMFLPVFGMIQKSHVNGQGFYVEFIQYAGMQPMPLVFSCTGLIILVGVCFLVQGLRNQQN